MPSRCRRSSPLAGSKRNMFQTQSWMSMLNALERIRQAVMKDGSDRCSHSYSSASSGVITQGKSRMQ